MSRPSFQELVLGALLLGGIVTLLLAMKDRGKATLHLVARDAWMLRQLCSATQRLMCSAPSVEDVAIDLTLIPHLDDETLALLDYACRRWTDAGACVVIAGCSAEVAKAVRRRGIGVDVRHSNARHQNAS